MHMRTCAVLLTGLVLVSGSATTSFAAPAAFDRASCQKSVQDLSNSLEELGDGVDAETQQSARQDVDAFLAKLSAGQDPDNADIEKLNGTMAKAGQQMSDETLQRMFTLVQPVMAECMPLVAPAS
ncbi:hypothetical protein ABT160_38000 [Streptomyces sp. NPDC001941]|uniref:hypothetical protein n=1 Tax=Streptomyces sp. NPDC001941 TaxID=3154659 RepID=UPI003328AB02